MEVLAQHGSKKVLSTKFNAGNAFRHLCNFLESKGLELYRINKCHTGSCYIEAIKGDIEINIRLSNHTKFQDDGILSYISDSFEDWKLIEADITCATKYRELKDLLNKYFK